MYLERRCWTEDQDAGGGPVTDSDLKVLLVNCGAILVPYMSLVTRKPVFRVFDQVRLKPACAATEAS